MKPTTRTLLPAILTAWLLLSATRPAQASIPVTPCGDGREYCPTITGKIRTDQNKPAAASDEPTASDSTPIPTCPGYYSAPGPHPCPQVHRSGTANSDTANSESGQNQPQPEPTPEPKKGR